MTALCVIALLTFLSLSQVSGHGRLVDPAGRSSLWRFDEYQAYRPAINYEDNELFCGGFPVQIENGNRCGVCGDAYHLPRPQENEGGGRYGRGIIARRYVSGQEIEVTVDLTSNHKGYFEYRLCPQNNPLAPVEQECLDQHVLQLSDGSGTKQIIYGDNSGLVTVRLQLPRDVSCWQCVLQWHYSTANTWGMCEDKSEALGCGPQETFRGCADIAIQDPVN